MDVEEAQEYLVEALRAAVRGGSLSNYGYSLWLPYVMERYAQQTLAIPAQRAGNFGGQCFGDRYDISQRCQELSPFFYAAAWNLCRMGILRPGVARQNTQFVEQGAAGDGYSITPQGREWLSQENLDVFMPAEPNRYTAALHPYADRFGAPFMSRAQEAVKCFGAQAYLACAAMCGAAAESILLATASAKIGEEAVLRAYRGASGRSRVEDRLLGGVNDYVRNDFRNLSSLLKYWRDDAAHGQDSGVTDVEAHIALTMLLRFAIYVGEHWSELTT